MIACQNLEMRVGYRPLFRNLSFQVENNQSLAILGPNGCGKTTLLRCLAGLVRPAKGTVALNGSELWPSRIETDNTTICYLSAQPALYLDQSVMGQLEFMCNTFGFAPTRNDLFSALEQVGLPATRAHQVVRTLSTGQKRRLTLAVLLLVKPNIILADEPTNGLDTEGTVLATQTFQDSAKWGASVIIATHDERLANQCSHQFNLMERLV